MYNEIIKQQSSHLNPSTFIMPLGNVTVLKNNIAHQETHFQVECRGQDGSYSRGFVSKIDREWRY